MAAEIEVKYFNAIMLRKVVRGQTEMADWIGLPWNPEFYPKFPLYADTSSDQFNWYVEESRIRGGFNNTEVDLGVRAYLSEEEREFSVADNSIIYSGIYNSLTSTNKTNVFSVGDEIVKDADPRYGSIQRLYAEDSDLLILQERKISQALIDKSAIYSARGDATVTSSELTIGKIQPYKGEYGIGKFPESFAVKGYRKYLADVPNNAVLRLSMDGFTEISKNGMEDFFRDEFRKLSAESKRVVYDLEWTPVFNTPITTIDIEGDNIGFVEYGMLIEGIIGVDSIYVDDIEEILGGLRITLSNEIEVTESPQSSIIQFSKTVRDRVIGGYDNNTDQYVLSIDYNEPIRSVEAGENGSAVIVTPEDELTP